MINDNTHVLVIGIDGVRFDILSEVPTPAIDTIAEQGFLQPLRVNDAGPTISGPSWSTITTGVLAPAARRRGVADHRGHRSWSSR